jgi:cyclase
MPLAKRIIPCLDVTGGQVVKGTNFLNLQNAGDPVEFAKRYSDAGADELVFLDITASSDNRDTLRDVVERVAKAINIPFTVGGGIRTESDARQILCSGADKTSVNTAAVQNPQLISKLANMFGQQCIVVAIDAKRNTPPKTAKLWCKHRRVRAGLKFTPMAVANQRVLTRCSGLRRRLNLAQANSSLPAWTATAPRMAMTST